MSYPVYTVFSGDVLPVLFDSFSGTTGAPITMTNFAVGDILIYKDGSITQRSSTSGFTLLDTDGIDFDALTGIHGFSIDTSDNTDAGFYAVGPWYHVVISPVTIDSQTMSFVACAFRIVPAETIAGQPKVDVASWLGTAANTPTVAGVPNVNARTWNDLTTVALPLVPTVAGRTLDVAAGGEAGVDFSNINGTLDAAEIGADAITAAKIADGAIDAATFAAGAINAAAIAADAIGASELAADAVTEIAAPILAVLGALNDVAADGDPTNTDTMVAYLKQLINTLEGTAGLPAFPAAAVAANAVSLAEVIRSIDTRLPTALVSGRVTADATAISGDSVAADRLEALMDGTIVAQVGAAASTTSLPSCTGFTEATDDHFNGRLITFISGALTGQQTAITDYVGGTQTFTVTALTESPAQNDFFVVH